MERADEPVQEGTPINKVLFDSIKNELHMYKEAMGLIDRYNTPTIKKSLINGSPTTGNFIPQSGWTAITAPTKYSNGDMIVSASNVNSGTAYNPLTSSTYDSWKGKGKNLTWTLDLGTPMEILTLNIGIYTNALNSAKCSWTIYGYNNSDETKQTLYSSNNFGDVYTITLNNTNKYRYYEVYFVLNSTSETGTINKFECTSYTGPADVLVLNNAIDSYFEEQRVLINIPTDMTLGNELFLDINNLGEIPINGEVIAGNRYELIYNEDSFEVLGV